MSTDCSGYPAIMTHEQQVNSENAATAEAMTMKALSVKLTDEYPTITELIPSRPKAEKSETTMAAVAQILAVFKLDGLGPPDSLIFPAIQQKGGRRLEEAEMQTFEKDISKYLTPEIIEDLEYVWFIWMETIKFASFIGAEVYAKDFYGPPHSIPWIEFIGIAVIVTKHYQLSAVKNSTNFYPMKPILNDVSRLRRWLRCNLKSDGFRRNKADWRICWDIINEMPDDNKQIPAVSVFKFGKKNTLFRFADEPKLRMLAEQDPKMEFEYEDPDVEMSEVEEEEEEEQVTGVAGDDEGTEENLHLKLEDKVMLPIKVEP